MDKQIIIDDYFRKIVDINGEIVDYEIKNSEVLKLVQKIEKYNSYIELKEQECEELKKIIQRHDNDNNALLKEVEDKLCEYYRRYKECLTEIKEIAENMNNECFYDDFECKDCDMKNGCTYFNKNQILQKISKCEVNNDNK